MSGIRPFVRQLGAQPGVQLNPLQDNTDGAVPDNSDQVFAMLGRFTRGRVDRPFRADKSNFLVKTGAAESIRTNALNEAKVQAYEAVYSGASEAVLMRLTPAAAVKSYALIDLGATTTVFTVAAALTGDDWSIGVMHHDCHNDGIRVAVHADITPISGSATPNPVVTLRVLDATGVLLHEFTGSLDPAAKDDFNQSLYLPDVVSAQTNAVEVFVHADADVVLVASDAYGRGNDGKDKFATSGVLVCFSEGGTTYAPSDYDRCIQALRDSQYAFGYMITGGTQVLSLIGKAAALAFEINVPIKIDLSGALTPAAAIALRESISFDAKYAHLAHFYWTPMTADDPLNGGVAMVGASGLNVGLSCARNARVNAFGFAPKNYPVAGKDFPLPRTRIRQSYRPSEPELSDLAKAQINPVLFERYNGGSLPVFTDSLTAARTVVSYRKLISVSEMATTLDGWVTLYAKELLQLPMAEFIKRMNRFLQLILEGAETSKWLVPSKNLAGNAAFAFSVKPSTVRPADLVLIDYWTSFDGVARQVIVQQTLTN